MHPSRRKSWNADEQILTEAPLFVKPGKAIEKTNLSKKDENKYRWKRTVAIQYISSGVCCEKRKGKKKNRWNFGTKKMYRRKKSVVMVQLSLAQKKGGEKLYRWIVVNKSLILAWCLVASSQHRRYPTGIPTVNSRRETFHINDDIRLLRRGETVWNIVGWSWYRDGLLSSLLRWFVFPRNPSIPIIMASTPTKIGAIATCPIRRWHVAFNVDSCALFIDKYFGK